MLDQHAAEAFVEAWIAENINGPVYSDDDEYDWEDAAQDYAAKCLTDAEASGISEADVRAAYPALETRMFHGISAYIDGQQE
ncbi:hypothetical protein [Falsirhodobacter sp. 20TX0035]|uniref:hypothetical protein n=1 Tax=Falsirhodobacter sp. 20TX0035 TaxID=3022019 RepID=UPI00232A8E08|nr:hypothetical protein [Falsirhodobacter sp. 20TX0035]MDB6454714.1 hypothetical protein [Falsirhodobacter sp. 20TX0035]